MNSLRTSHSLHTSSIHLVHYNASITSILRFCLLQLASPAFSMLFRSKICACTAIAFLGWIEKTASGQLHHFRPARWCTKPANRMWKRFVNCLVNDTARVRHSCLPRINIISLQTCYKTKMEATRRTFIKDNKFNKSWLDAKSVWSS